VPTPAPNQSQPIVIKGAIAHLGNGQVIENSAIAFENGKITVVGNANDRRAYPNHKEIDASGKHIYPGFIAPNTNLGLVEIGAVRATRDYSEVGSFNPNIRSIIAYNTDSEIQPTVRSMGTLLAQIVPQSGRISGSSSIVELDAWNWEDAAYALDNGLHLRWPSSYSYSWRQRRLDKNERYNDQLEETKSFFKEAAAYMKKASSTTKNLKFEALRGIFSGGAKLFIHTNTAESIEASVKMAKSYGITPVIIGGRDAWMITDFLKNNDVSVILGETHSLPNRQHGDIDQPFKTPAQLQKAGVLFAFSGGDNWQNRNLGFQAGHAVSFGLEYEDAVKALTSNTAQILGVGKTVGTIAEGMDATIFVSEGDALDMRTATVTHAFIQGKEIDLDNKQKQLYKRFQTKYERQQN
jgi:imidazolonepropionase-like amidohydrolase